MSNLTDSEATLINSVITATSNDTLTWHKVPERGFNCFGCTVNNQRFLADKYYSFSDNQTRECFNFTIVNSDDRIIIEIVRCFEPESSGFQILKSLYNKIETQFNAKIDQDIIPILSEITGSLNALQHH